MEKYDEEKRIECTLLCGHRSCFECLNKLPNKNCPTCRKAFTNEQIIKLFKLILKQFSLEIALFQPEIVENKIEKK
ncbi:unnamed protein product [Oikopleura dioica]|uniref:RING-type domain-containing protein n=1 Tax=Oikopleura dioica TaxID=34765 RepID=E4YSA3_OIKDI|nr:unnamed protein product [Oikopleura dioica]